MSKGNNVRDDLRSALALRPNVGGGGGHTDVGWNMVETQQREEGKAIVSNLKASLVITQLSLKPQH